VGLDVEKGSNRQTLHNYAAYLSLQIQQGATVRQMTKIANRYGE
jgi:hypothetical protein